MSIDFAKKITIFIRKNIFLWGKTNMLKDVTVKGTSCFVTIFQNSFFPKSEFGNGFWRNRL